MRWRPSPVQLGHPEGNTPAWLQFRGQYGAPGCITSEAFWKYQGEPLRRCSPEVMANDGCLVARAVQQLGVWCSCGQTQGGVFRVVGLLLL